MTTETIISLASLLIAVAAALFSWLSNNHSNKANQIAHESKNIAKTQLDIQSQVFLDIEQGSGSRSSRGNAYQIKGSTHVRNKSLIPVRLASISIKYVDRENKEHYFERKEVTVALSTTEPDNSYQCGFQFELPIETPVDSCSAMYSVDYRCPLTGEVKTYLE
ncbi:MAG: hypothetical protein QE263_00055 [Vampirovibrionales bacterium]|nr:hypothetical protein [Vampirovibrionales bacterium]